MSAATDDSPSSPPLPSTEDGTQSSDQVSRRRAGFGVALPKLTMPHLNLPMSPTAKKVLEAFQQCSRGLHDVISPRSPKSRTGVPTAPEKLPPLDREFWLRFYGDVLFRVSWRIETRAKARHQAAIRLQCFFRQQLALRRAEALRLEAEEAARSEVIRRNEAYNEAIRRRRRMRKLRAAVMEELSCVFVRAVVHEGKRPVCALLIQRVWRGHRGRRVAAELRAQRPKPPAPPVTRKRRTTCRPRRISERISAEAKQRVWARTHFVHSGWHPANELKQKYGMMDYIESPPRGPKQGLRIAKVRLPVCSEADRTSVLKDKNTWIGVPVGALPPPQPRGRLGPMPRYDTKACCLHSPVDWHKGSYLCSLEGASHRCRAEPRSVTSTCQSGVTCIIKTITHPGEYRARLHMPPRLLEHLWGQAPQADNAKKATAPPSEGSDLDVASNTTPATEHSDDGDHFDDVDVSICSDDLGNLESTVRGLCQSLEMDGFYLHSATAVQAADQRDLVAQRRTTRALSFNDASTAPLTLEEFIAVLPGVVERCNITSLKKCEPVKELFNRLQLGKSEWARFAFWDPDKLYTRNLVATDNRTFTLLLLCWNPGRESPIHDHPCEGCWVKTLQGEVLETIYEQDASSRLVPVRENLFHESELSYIEDSLGFHKVGNTGSVGAVTLHCYIPPPKMCRVWMAPNSRLCDAHMVETALFSAYGQRLPCCSKTMLTQMAATGDK